MKYKYAPHVLEGRGMSPPVRGAWVEMLSGRPVQLFDAVAPCAGGVG